MAANNLRIVSTNRVTSVGGTWSGTANNVLNDYRSQYATTAAASFTATISSAFVVGTNIAVIVVLANTSTSISMTATATNFTSSTGNTVVSGATTYGKGGGQYIAVYGTVTGGSSGTTFTINLPSGTNVSRIIIGEYWSPKYNTGFGIQTGFNDNSTSERTQSGDLYTIYGTRNKTLSLSLEYMDESDKYELYDIIKYCGKMIPIFISIFPSDTDLEKEQMFSIYGKFTDLTTITHSKWTIYSSSISLEEI